MLNQAGGPSADALAGASSRAAQALGLDGRVGAIRAGLEADLMVVDGDPLRDLGALGRVRAVFKGGREVKR